MSAAVTSPGFRSLRHRFPGALDGWARFDAPAGTQIVDTAIDATTAWMRGASMACAGGWFDASVASGELVDRARATVGRLFGADPAGVCFGPNMTSLTFSFSRTVGATLRPGDRVIGTRLDHEANVSPWRIACRDAGAEHVLAPIDPATGTLPPEHVIGLIDERTRWVTLPGASNLLGTAPDLAPIVAAAHAVGARVFVDAVALAPHRRIDVATLGVDALVSSPYKWYGPHSGTLWVDPTLLDELPVVKVRPAPDAGPGRFETGMPNYEAIAGIEAAAQFLIDEDMDALARSEMEVFAPMMHGLQSISGVEWFGPRGLDARTPTAAFRITGMTPSDVARALAADRIAVWDGHNYAVEVVDSLGLSDTGGVVRAGLARYVEPDDVERLLAAVERLAARHR
jgi:cysteine desulfurase family protein (TIGR01976 family)